MTTTGVCLEDRPEGVFEENASTVEGVVRFAYPLSCLFDEPC